MNAREKAVKNLPLGEVAKQATELVCCRIKDELPGEPMVAAFHTNEIIDQVIRSFLPMETIRKMDLIVDTRYDGSTWKGVVQAVTVTVGFRKSHPFYSEQKGRLPYGAVTLVIKRKRTPKGLVFQRFECDHKEAGCPPGPEQFWTPQTRGGVRSRAGLIRNTSAPGICLPPCLTWSILRSFTRTEAGSCLDKPGPSASIDTP